MLTCTRKGGLTGTQVSKNKVSYRMNRWLAPSVFELSGGSKEGDGQRSHPGLRTGGGIGGGGRGWTLSCRPRNHGTREVR